MGYDIYKRIILNFYAKFYNGNFKNSIVYEWKLHLNLKSNNEYILNKSLLWKIILISI